MGLLDGFNLDPVINSFKSKTSQAMESVKSNTLTPIDQTAKRLDEGIALTNSNDTSLKGTISAYRSSIVSSLDSIVGAVSGGILNTKDITKAIRIDANGVRLDTDALVTAAGSALGYNVWGKQGVKDLLAKTLGDEFNRLTGLNMTGLIQVNNEEGFGGFRVNGNWRSQVGGATLDMLKGYSGIDEFLDVSTQAAVNNAILYNTALFGMKDAYETIWENYPYLGLRQDAFIEAMQVMVTNADIESISKVLELLDVEGKNVLLNKYPDFIEVLFSRFQFDADLHPDDYGVLREKLLVILTTVAGGEWYMLQTELGKAYNLGLVSDISTDMKTLLIPVDELAPFLCAAGMFTRESAATALNSVFDNPPIQIA